MRQAPGTARGPAPALGRRGESPANGALPALKRGAPYCTVQVTVDGGTEPSLVCGLNVQRMVSTVVPGG